MDEHERGRFWLTVFLLLILLGVVGMVWWAVIAETSW